MIPTVAALRPDNRAYTGSGSCSLTCAMPRARPNDATAPGKLRPSQMSLKPTVDVEPWSHSPPDKERDDTREEASVNDIDTVDHLSAPWTRKSLTKGK